MDGLDKLWQALRFVRGVAGLLPDQPAGISRLDRCLAAMHERVEESTFGPVTKPTAEAHEAAMGDVWAPVTYPVQEANQLIAASKDAILRLAPLVEMESSMRVRLTRELTREGDYFEPDPRGTIEAFVSPTGPTEPKMRNNGRLDAVMAFLHGLRNRPYAAVLASVQTLSEVEISPEILSVDVKSQEVTCLGVKYQPGIEACVFVDLLLRSRPEGGWVSTEDVKEELAKLKCPVVQLRPDRIKAKLPDKLRDAIETTQHGSRFVVGRLLANV